jgi:hypothetical protein
MSPWPKTVVLKLQWFRNWYAGLDKAKSLLAVMQGLIPFFDLTAKQGWSRCANTDKGQNSYYELVLDHGRYSWTFQNEILPALAEEEGPNAFKTRFQADATTFGGTS